MVISIDWVQLHVRGNIARNTPYQFKQLDYSTQVFKCVEDVYFNDVYIASVCSIPRSSVIHPLTVIVKIINNILYHPDKWSIITSFIDSLQCEYIGITRLDICADFNTFYNGLYPETLINKFMTMQARKVGQSKGQCHFHQRTSMNYSTLKFGTGESVVCSYLYNKTKELNEVKMKQYIVDMWQSSGIDVNKQVWRLEFSIKGNSLALLDKSTGELNKPNLQTLQDKDFIYKLYYSLQNQYFKFVKFDGKKNISRAPPITLLPPYPTDSKRVFLTESGDGSRADKIFLKKLDGLNNELRNYAKLRQNNIDELVCEFAISKGLTEYYVKKCKGVAYDKLKYLITNQSSVYDELSKIDNNKSNSQSLFNYQDECLRLNKLILQSKQKK